MEELKQKIEGKLLKEISEEADREKRYFLIQSYSDFVMVGLKQKELDFVVKQ